MALFFLSHVVFVLWYLNYKTQGTVTATARWTTDRVYRLHRFCRARTSEDLRSYVADKNSWREYQIYRE